MVQATKAVRSFRDEYLLELINLDNVDAVHDQDVDERVERTNADGRYGVEDVRGVSNTKLIQKTKANMEGRDFTPFTILNPKEFVFNRFSKQPTKDSILRVSTQIGWLIPMPPVGGRYLRL